MGCKNWAEQRAKPHPVRFWEKVAVTGNVCECWEWTAAKILKGYARGYGRFNINGRSMPAHGVAYRYALGEVPSGLELDHLCSNRGCVNPWHLEPVTHRENMRRAGIEPTRAAVLRARTHCPKGHPYDEANTYTYRNASGGPARSCVTCSRASTRAWRERRRAARAG